MTKKTRMSSKTRSLSNKQGKPLNHPSIKRQKQFKKAELRQNKIQQAQRSLHYIAFWKPYDVLSQFTPAKNSTANTLSSFITIPHIYPVGRLDRDSEGLLLLSNDGLFQHKLCDPRFEHWRTYLVQIEGIPSIESLECLSQGVEIKGQLTRHAKVTLLTNEPVLPPRTPPIRERKTVPTSWLRISLTEGMNRQVRRMTAAVGHPTLRLVREEIDLNDDLSITLEELKPGEYRHFTTMEIKALQSLKKKKPSRSTRRN